MRASRLVQLLLLLQTRGNMTAPELAAELEVSVRTVYRDLEALSAAGVPVYSEPGRGGGARLVDGYRTRLTGLTTEEADAVLLAGLPGAAADLGLGTVLAAAQLKMLAALPPELRGRATRVRERFHLDAPGWFKRPESAPQLGAVAEALWDDRRVDIRYERPDRVVQRRVDPLGLVLKAGTWYLTARHRNEVRTYRVSRITEATVLDERFDRPGGFDLAGHWAESMAAFERSMLRAEARCRVRADRIDDLRHAIDPAAAKELVVGDEPADDGWVEVLVPTESLDYLAVDILRMGAGVEVLEPLELRERVATVAREMSALYASASPRGLRPQAPSPSGSLALARPASPRPLSRGAH